MNRIEKLMAFFRRPKEETEGKVPPGVCPNCWGEQEYDHKIRKLYEDRQIDVNNQEEHYTFIKDFVVKYIDGIHLKKEEDRYTCPTCHVKYPEEKVE